MQMMTTAEAAAALGVTVGRVRQLVAEGRLPSRKFGNALVFTPEDLDRVRVRTRTGRPKKNPEKNS